MQQQDSSSSKKKNYWNKGVIKDIKGGTKTKIVKSDASGTSMPITSTPMRNSLENGHKMVQLKQLGGKRHEHPPSYHVETFWLRIGKTSRDLCGKHLGATLLLFSILPYRSCIIWSHQPFLTLVGMMVKFLHLILFYYGVCWLLTPTRMTRFALPHFLFDASKYLLIVPALSLCKEVSLSLLRGFMMITTF